MKKEEAFAASQDHSLLNKWRGGREDTNKIMAINDINVDDEFKKPFNYWITKVREKLGKSGMILKEFYEWNDEQFNLHPDAISNGIAWLLEPTRGGQSTGEPMIEVFKFVSKTHGECQWINWIAKPNYSKSTKKPSFTPDFLK